VSINAGKLVAQHSSTLGGGNLGNGSGRFSDKVIKIQVEEVQMLCVIF
jgi:sulfite reductase (ferredoxin)